MRAFLNVRRINPYPYRPLEAGLRAAGCPPAPVEKADVLVTWTPWIGSSRAALVDRFGIKNTIVVENGWLSPIGDVPYYQIAWGGWNGAGAYPDQGDRRFSSWGLEFKPVSHKKPRRVLVIEQRGHPKDRRTMQPGWAEQTAGSLTSSGMKIRLRDKRAPRPLAEDLAWATDVVTWSSNAANWAILQGVPVFYAGPDMMLHDLMIPYRGPSSLNRENYRDREPVLERAAWAQWNAGEIASGLPFKRLLDVWRRSSL